MVLEFKDFLTNAVSTFHAVDQIIQELKKNNFTELGENEVWNLEKNKGYYVVRDGSSLIAFKTNDLSIENYGFNIVGSHTDSPVIKIKNNPEMKVANYIKLNTETYGGALLYSWLDKPLKLAGRVICKNIHTGEIEAKLFESEQNFIIPSVALHMYREVNENGLKLNKQTDLLPLCALDEEKGVMDKIISKKIDYTKYKVLDYDLVLNNDTKPFFAGLNNEFLCSPRLDNLTSVHTSMEALINSDGKRIGICAVFNHEEVGSETMQGAGGKFLIDTIERINYSLGRNYTELDIALSNSFFISCDNAHAIHPNHPEYNDPTNIVLLNGGIVVKYHANQNYTTDYLSGAIFKEILDKNGIKHQDFFMRSDMKCGGTLGTSSVKQVSVRSIDIGLSQLAMHSNMETMGAQDYEYMFNGLKEFYNSKIDYIRYNKVKVD